MKKIEVWINNGCVKNWERKPKNEFGSKYFKATLIIEEPEHEVTITPSVLASAMEKHNFDPSAIAEIRGELFGENNE